MSHLNFLSGIERRRVLPVERDVQSGDYSEELLTILIFLVEQNERWWAEFQRTFHRDNVS